MQASLSKRKKTYGCLRVLENTTRIDTNCKMTEILNGLALTRYHDMARVPIYPEVHNYL